MNWIDEFFIKSGLISTPTQPTVTKTPLAQPPINLEGATFELYQPPYEAIAPYAPSYGVKPEVTKTVSLSPLKLWEQFKGEVTKPSVTTPRWWEETKKPAMELAEASMAGAIPGIGMGYQGKKLMDVYGRYIGEPLGEAAYGVVAKQAGWEKEPAFELPWGSMEGEGKAKIGVRGIVKELGYLPLWITPGGRATGAIKVSKPLLQQAEKFAAKELQSKGIQAAEDVARKLTYMKIPEIEAQKIVSNMAEKAGLLKGVETVVPKVAEKMPEVSMEKLFSKAKKAGVKLEAFEITSAEQKAGYRFKVIASDGREFPVRNNAEGLQRIQELTAAKISEVAPKVGGIVPPAKLAELPKPKAAEMPPIKPPEPPIGEPKYNPEDADAIIKQFSEALVSPKGKKLWNMAVAQRSKEFGERLGKFQARAEELVIEGVTPGDAITQAMTETMKGKYPSVTTNIFEEVTEQIKDALFSKVYRVLKDDIDLISTAEALRHALQGKPVPRISGAKGGSAYTRLFRVFGDNPEVMKALEQKKPLKDIIGDLGLGTEPIQFDPELLNYFRNLPTVPSGQARLGELPWQMQKVAPDPRTAMQRELDLQTFKMELADLIPTEKAPTRFEAPINDALKVTRFKNMPAKQQNILIRALRYAGLTTMDIGNFIRANKASLDFSYWRQQAPMILGNLKSFVRSNIDGLKGLKDAFKSEGFAEQAWGKITRSPLYGKYEQLGLDFLRPLKPTFGMPQYKGVEEFGFLTGERPIQRFTEKLPWVRASNKAFITATNSHNWQMFENFYKAMLKVNENLAMGKAKLKPNETFSIDIELKKFGKMLESFSGREQLGKAAPLAPAINAGIFAARLNLGRLFTPKHLFSSSKYVRREAWKNLGSFVAGMSSILLAGKAAGIWDIDTRPKTADFMKVRVGNTRIDFWGGYQQNVVFLFRMLTKTGISSVSGEEYIVDPLRTGTYYMRGKLHPLAATILDFWTGETFLGEKVDIKNMRQWVDRLAPFLTEDLWAAYEDNWAVGLAVTMPAILGAGISTYETKPKKTTPYKKTTTLPIPKRELKR